MPPPRPVARYRARDGTEHEIFVLRSAAGRWRIVDADARAIVHVETLLGWDDRLSQAIAVARDYAEQRQAFLTGERETDPLPTHRPDPPAEPAATPAEPAATRAEAA